MARRWTIRLLSVAALALFASGAAGGVSPEDVVRAVGADQGICIVLGADAADLALDLADETELLIYMQVRGSDTPKLRQRIERAGLYGSRILVGTGARRLCLADSIADVVVSEYVAFPAEEILRVLRPGGKAFLKGRTIDKAFPEGVDDWSHPYHGPDNNPQSDDEVVVAPYLTQFLAEPRYAPLPQVAVASAGRVFKAFGHVAFKVREEPFLNNLVAFNGYNGSILWQRDLSEGVMIHRNTMIATPKTLYLGDDESCKVIDAATGQLRDEIAPPVDVAGGTFWKWMALEDGVLYAMLGGPEQRDPTKRWRRDKHGWPWAPISKGFNQPENPWGYGRSILAVDPETKGVLWSHRENEPMDGRALCMSDGRIYLFRFGSYLACLDAKTGDQIWRRTPENAPTLFRSLGEYQQRQDWRTNWRTTCYLKCSDKALYFAGPPVGKLLALSTEDGHILWEHPYSNFQLVLRADGLYGISGQIDNHPSLRFDPLTGEVLGEVATHRRACTRPTASADAIFYRAHGGSVRLDLASDTPQWISPMRPNCHDGVTIANGLLYWWPSVCDCQLTLYGITCLGPAGDFDFEPSPAARFEPGGGPPDPAPLPISTNDWPTFRADGRCAATTAAPAVKKAEMLWSKRLAISTPAGLPRITAPVAAGGLAFIGGADGIVRAIEAQTGELAWQAFTGGAIRMPPTIWEGRAFVGSGDGWVYAFEARTGRLLWRFRAAPVERMIPVYGSLMSTWPVATGVLVEDGVAYCAAGIANYDGTYVYALDARTGEVKWSNTFSGHLDANARTGVSVQGHLLLHDGRLYLAGGTSVSPAVYDAATGRCLNEAGQLAECFSRSPRGWELSLLGDRVVACGRPFYGHPEQGVYDNTVFHRAFLGSTNERSVVWASDPSRHRILSYEDLDRKALTRKLADPGSRFQVDWRKLAPSGNPAWSADLRSVRAVAICANTVVAATDSEVLALSASDGERLWSRSLPAPPTPWGLAVDAAGRVVLTLDDGRVLCFGRGEEAEKRLLARRSSAHND